MSIIAWIVLGAIAGYLAGFLVKGDESIGVIGHIVLGIVGALVGGFLAGALFGTRPDRRRARHQLDRHRDDRRRHRGRRVERPHRAHEDRPRHGLAHPGRPAAALRPVDRRHHRQDAHRLRWASAIRGRSASQHIERRAAMSRIIEDDRGRRARSRRLRPVDPVRVVPAVHGGRRARRPARRHARSSGRPRSPAR